MKTKAVQKEIVGAERVDQMYATASRRLGAYPTRAGIDLKTRELLTFAMLAAHGGCDPQVRGHVAANVNVGNDRRVLLAVITQLLLFMGYPRTLNALAAINEIAPAPTGGTA